MITLFNFCVSAILTLPGTWLTYRRGFLRGFAASGGVALIIIIGLVVTTLAENKIRYGYWDKPPTQTDGNTLQFTLIYALAVVLLIWMPLQLIGIGVAWAIRRRKRRSRG